MSIFIILYLVSIIAAWVGLYIYHDGHYHAMHDIFIMWALMVLAMMGPSFIKTIITYKHIGYSLVKKQVKTYPVIIIAGYITIWLVFSIIAAILEYYARQYWLVTMNGALTNMIIGAIILLVTSGYQFSPLKQYCVSKCRTPNLYFLHNYKYNLKGSYYMGLELGLYCLGCCIFLMICAFIGGTMNLYWMALFTIIMVVEKLSLPKIFDKILGAVFFALAILYVLYYNDFLNLVS